MIAKRSLRSVLKRRRAPGMVCFRMLGGHGGDTRMVYSPYG